MSLPLEQQPQPQQQMPQQQQQQPPPLVSEQLYTNHSSHGGSIGAVIAVLAVITVLGVVAGMIGRLCSGRRRIMGHGQYDLEGWVERKCSSCIDGSIGPPPPSNTSTHDSIPVAIPVVEISEERKHHQNPPSSSIS